MRWAKKEIYTEDPALLGTRILEILERHGYCRVELRHDKGILVSHPATLTVMEKTKPALRRIFG